MKQHYKRSWMNIKRLVKNIPFALEMILLTYCMILGRSFHVNQDSDRMGFCLNYRDFNYYRIDSLSKEEVG